ncbi:MAG: ABC transporter substrate-binding protein [Treponema sp.]
MKKLVFGLTALALSVSVVCAKPSKKAKAKMKNVYLITMDQMDQYWMRVNEGAKKAAKEEGGVNYRWLAPDIKDDSKQIECINNAVAAGADAILLAANGPTAITSAVKEAAGKGIKIIYVDSPADFPAVQTLSTDNRSAGKTAGETMMSALKKKGVMSGAIGVISVNAATASTVAREEGFRSAFEGSDYTVLVTQYCDGDAARSKDAAANFITQGCVGIFGANEGSTVGIGNAVAESGGKVVGVGFDNSDMIKNLIKKGALHATMVQNPAVMGYEGVKSAVKSLKGDPVSPQEVDTGVSVQTAESM